MQLLGIGWAEYVVPVLFTETVLAPSAFTVVADPVRQT